MQIPSATLAEKRNGDSREKKRKRYGSQAFLIYPKCRRSVLALAALWLAGWLQARARVRAISISGLYMPHARMSWSITERKREKGKRVCLFVYDRKQIRVAEEG